MISESLVEFTPGRLLIIDDESLVLKTLKTILSRAKYDVVACETAAEALHFLSHESFDCIITDAVMPITNGYDLVKTIRKDHLTDLPILMLTRKRHRQDVKKAVEAGITDYVLKPIDEHLLLDKVEACIKKGGGKRHIMECPIYGEQSKAKILINSVITSISESYITMNLAMPVESQSEFEMKAPLYDEIGIHPPLIKLIICREISKPHDSQHLRYEAKFSMIGVPESDLRKIRNWINQEEIRRRK